jgi:hypothetical protein
VDRTFEAASGRSDCASRQSRGRGQRRRRIFLINVTVAVVGAAAAALFGLVLVSQPQATVSTAQQFFDNYYRQATQAGSRNALYLKDLTPAFRESPGSDWHDYNSWWELWKQVDVKKVESDPGNPLEFNVWLEYYPTRGQPTGEEDSFSLICSAFWASLEARIPALGCPADHLQFQSQLYTGETT